MRSSHSLGQHLDQVVVTQIALGMTLVGLIVILPFGVYRMAAGDVPVATLIVTLLTLQCLVALYLLRGGSGPIGIHLLALCFTAGVTTVALLRGEPLTYWLFPAVVANFYALPARSALLLNGLALLGTAPVLLADPAAGVRLAATLGLVGLFGYVFSRRMAMHRMELNELALLDPLTGIGNRRALSGELARVIREQRYGIRASLIMLDLDDFKIINDRHGHSAGDEVIRGLVAAISGRLRDADRLFRYGGEEFVIVCRHVSARNAANLAENLRSLLADTAHPYFGRVTGSFGVAEWRRGEAPEAWLARADSMMYRAKESGRDRVCVDADPDPARAGNVTFLAEAQQGRHAS